SPGQIITFPVGSRWAWTGKRAGRGESSTVRTGPTAPSPISTRRGPVSTRRGQRRSAATTAQAWQHASASWPCSRAQQQEYAKRALVRIMVADGLRVTDIASDGDDVSGRVDADRLSQHECGRRDEIIQIEEPCGGSPDEGAATKGARQDPDDVTALIDAERLAGVAARERAEIDDRPPRRPQHCSPATDCVRGVTNSVGTCVHSHRLARRVTRQCPQVLRAAPAWPQDCAETGPGGQRANRIALLVDPPRPTRLSARRAW